MTTDDAGPDKVIDRGSRANARRERIVAAARELFAERGFQGSSVARISQRCGVLVGQIYRDFANKEAIVAAIVERDLEEFLRDADLHDASQSCDEAAVRGWIAHFVSGHQRADARLVAEIMAEAARNDRVAAIFHAIDERLRVQLIRALRVIVPASVDEDDLTALAETVMTLSAGVFQRRLSMAGCVQPGVLRALTASVDRAIDALIAKGRAAMSPD